MGVFEPEHDMCISIHALLAESDKLWTSFAPNPKTFLSTLSLRRATYQKRSSKTHDRQFLSTLSLRRATHGTNSGTNSTLFLSTLSLRRATFIVVALRHIHSVISIHALLAESDSRHQEQNGVLGISIHALLAESDCSASRYRSMSS